MSEEEVAEAGRVVAGAVGLKGGEGLEDVEGSVLQAVRGEAQTQVHGVCRSDEEEENMLTALRLSTRGFKTTVSEYLQPNVCFHEWK